MTTTEQAWAPEGEGATATPQAPRRRSGGGRRLLVASMFLIPALVLLGALVVYPIFYSVVRSTYDRPGTSFVALGNYERIFTDSQTFISLRNTVLWVVIVPATVTAIGLVFAVLTERVKWSTAFKTIVFMPMAISFLAAGVIWRIVFEIDPNRGLMNAGLQGVAEIVRGPGAYPGARPSVEDAAAPTGDGGFRTTATHQPGETVNLGLVAIPPDLVPEEAQPAATEVAAGADEIAGAIWLDFTPGGEGERGRIDAGERGLPGATVAAISPDGTVVAEATAGDDGTFVLTGLDPGTEYRVELTAATFREPFAGYTWLATPLVIPATWVAYIWIWAGFAMVVIASGLAAIPREMLEAARVDGATEWQVFRRVTVPLLSPVLVVVLVTLVINVLKVFDLVLVLVPDSAQRDANVIALQMWRASFGGGRDFGLGSALAVFLFLLVVPAMLFNLKRFRTESR
jgi:alpha-glucoside transport system permease protein